QRPQAEHVEELAAHLGLFLLPVLFRLDVGKGVVGELLRLEAEVVVAEAVAVGRRRRRRRGGGGREGGDEQQQGGEGEAHATAPYRAGGWAGRSPGIR